VYGTGHSCQILMKRVFSRHIFEKCTNIKFQENTSSGSRVYSCGRIDGQADMMKLLITFRNFAYAPKNECKREYAERDSNPRL